MVTVYVKPENEVKVPEIQMISPLKLKADGKNPNKMPDSKRKALKLNIERYGFLVPIITNKDYLIADGQHRWEIAQDLDMKEVPVIALDVKEVDRRMLRQIMNKLKGTHDFDLDAEEFKFITDYGNLEEFKGLSDIDPKNINQALDSLTPTKEEDFDTEKAAKEPKYKIELGDIYKLGDHRLMCGDSTDYVVVKSFIGESKIDIVLTDPPYGIKVVKSNKVGADFGIAKKGEYSQIIGDGDINIAEKAYSIIKDISKKSIIFGGNYFSSFLDNSTGWLIWDKRVDTGIRNTFADGELAWCSFHTPIRIYRQLWNGMIREGEHEKRVHPTQKPVRMLSDILKDFTKEDENVLDLFGGSGSTLIACENLNRKCYMMELDPKYCSVIIERWENLTGKKAEKEEKDGK